MKKLLFSFFLIGLSHSVNAALISSDWQLSGDNLLTIDNTTDLEWLDWSYTLNRSFLDVSSQFGTGGEFEGFRYATRNELTDLYSHTGFNYPTSNDHSNVLFAQNFTHLFGITFGAVAPDNGGTEVLYNYSTTSEKHWVTAISHGNGLVQLEWFEESDTNKHLFVGSALVRTSVVPVPTAVWLFGSGLLGFIGMRKKASKI